MRLASACYTLRLPLIGATFDGAMLQKAEIKEVARAKEVSFPCREDSSSSSSLATAATAASSSAPRTVTGTVLAPQCKSIQAFSPAWIKNNVSVT